MPEFELNKAKSVTALLYICQKLGGSWDKYSLLKILYFAEEKHLVKYGRPITGENIIAMKHGPVPSVSYDHVKRSPQSERYFAIEDDVVTAKQLPDLDYMSNSDIRCIDESIDENASLNFTGLKRKSHTEAYDRAVAERGLNTVIPFIEIARACKATPAILEYIEERIDFKEWAQLVKLGDVIKIFDTDLFKPKVKWIIIVGDKSGDLACIYINTNTRPENLTPELQGSQYPLAKNKCIFLDHDSFADCSFLVEKDKGKINEILQKEPGRKLGHIPSEIFFEILRLIKISDGIETFKKKKYGFHD